MAPRRPTHVALSLAQARAMFKQQALLPVKDALGVIHEAQRAMHDEPNVAQVRCPIGADAAVFGASSRSYHMCRNAVAI